MRRFLADLAMAKDTVDVNLAAGITIDWWGRVKSIMLIGLLAVSILLTVAYAHLESEISNISAQQQDAKIFRVKAERERQQMLKLLKEAAGK